MVRKPVSSSLIFLSLASTIVMAADSYNFSSSKPVTNPAAAYLLDSGFVPFTTNYLPSTCASTTTPNTTCHTGCGGVNTASCDGYTTTNSRQCATGFTPFVSLVTSKSQGQGAGATNICLADIGKVGTSLYRIHWKSTAVSVYNHSDPSVSFYWYVYCYPNTGLTTPPVDSSCSVPPRFDAPIFLAEAGYTQPDTGGSLSTKAKSKTFTTSRRCPWGTAAYFQITYANPMTPNGDWDMQGAGACISSVAESATGYTVTYLRTIKGNYYNVTVGGQRTTYSEDVYVYNYWGTSSYKINAGSWDRAIVNKVSQTTDRRQAHDYTNYNGYDIFYYQLYCVPIAMAANYQNPSNCTSSTPPFN